MLKKQIDYILDAESEEIATLEAKKRLSNQLPTAVFSSIKCESVK